jgi:biopolymer transport protein ExbD
MTERRDKMARRKRRRYEMKTMDQIDMTPLLDLTFLLLIVFMISMPLMEYGTKIEPPAMNSDELPLDNIKSVSITEAGTIMFGNQAVSKEELVEKLKALKATDPKMNLLLRADGSRKYNDVISLMALIRSAGFADVTLVTQAEDK